MRPMAVIPEGLRKNDYDAVHIKLCLNRFR